MRFDLQKKKENYFKHDADIGLIAHGETIESCFADAARVMFALMGRIDEVHLLEIITFEFEEADLEFALVTWLNLVLAKSYEHHLMFGDFRLKHENNKWFATVSGEPWRDEMERGIEVKGATLTMLSVKKINHSWEARCVLDV